MSIIWLRDAGARAVRTFCQSLLTCIGTGAMGLMDVDWGQALSFSGLMALVSLLTSVTASKFGDPDSATFTGK